MIDELEGGKYVNRHLAAPEIIKTLKETAYFIEARKNKEINGEELLPVRNELFKVIEAFDLVLDAAEKEPEEDEPTEQDMSDVLEIIRKLCMICGGDPDDVYVEGTTVYCKNEEVSRTMRTWFADKLQLDPEFREHYIENGSD